MRLFSSNQRRQFEKQAQPLSDSLYHAALQLTRQTEWAEDLVQDTLIRAYERYELFQQGTNFRAWLFTVLTHTYLNNCERVKRRPVTASYDTANDQGSTWEFPSGQESDPAEILTGGILDENLQRALDALAEDFRIAVLLVDMEELSYQEAADALGVPIGTVRSRVSRGRGQLRQMLTAATQQVK